LSGDVVELWILDSSARLRALSRVTYRGICCKIPLGGVGAWHIILNS